MSNVEREARGFAALFGLGVEAYDGVGEDAWLVESHLEDAEEVHSVGYHFCERQSPEMWARWAREEGEARLRFARRAGCLN